MFKASDPSEKNPERKKQAANKVAQLKKLMQMYRKKKSEFQRSLVYTKFLLIIIFAGISHGPGHTERFSLTLA